MLTSSGLLEAQLIVTWSTSISLAAFKSPYASHGHHQNNDNMGLCIILVLTNTSKASRWKASNQGL